MAVLDKAGPGISYMRAALTNVKLAEKTRSLLSLAVTAVSGTASRISLKEAVLEVGMLDSATGERRGVLVDKVPTTAGDEAMSWGAINKTFTFYAERLKARMQAAK